MPKKSTSIKYLCLAFAISVCAIVATATAKGRPAVGRAHPARVGPGNTTIGGDLPYKPGELMVRFDETGYGMKQMRVAEKTAVRKAILAMAGGGSVKREFARVSGLAVVKLPAGLNVQNALVSYNNTPGILYAEPNYKYRLFITTPNDPNFAQLWGMDNTGQTGGTADADIDAPEAWDVNTGEPNIVVAVTDTGVDYNHPDLAANMWINPGEIADGNDTDGNGYIDDIYGYDFAGADVNDPNDGDSDPCDYSYHGTHVAGTIGAVGDNNEGVTGVCWNVSIMALKIFADNADVAYADDAIEAIEYAVDNDANVINASWGGGSFSQALYDAIKAAGDAGVLFVAAAGNEDNNNDSFEVYPASYDLDNIISVMATDHDDDKSSFSNYGTASVDLGAPGTDILSTFPTYMTADMNSEGLSTDYETISGTSMAAPHAAGACALIWSVNPNLTHTKIKEILLLSVDPNLPGLCVSGGRLNLFNAVNMATAILKTIYVDDDSPNNPGTGTYDDPFRKIQDAINAAIDGDIIDVNDGIYMGLDNYNIDTKGKAITIESQNGPQNCIIDCNSNGRAFIFQSGEAATTVLEGFTIKNGYAEDPSPPYDPNDPNGYGGAIYCTASSPKISNCVITDNEADYGGGAIFCDTGSNPLITDCDISFNYCGSYRYDVNQVQIGGGIYCRNSSPTISGCDITENWVEGWWKKGAGGAIACEDSNAVIVDCNIIYNECWALYSGDDDPNDNQDGGGIYIEGGSPAIINCSIIDNFANYSGGGIAASDSDVGIFGCYVNYNICGASGGGVYSEGNSVPYMQNCLITKNKGYWGGGVASSYGSLAWIVNCTIAKNNVDWPDLAGGIRCKNGSALVTDSIIWANAGRSINAPGGTVAVIYSDVQMHDSNNIIDPDPNNIWPGEGNINADPLFANPIRYDYHLQSEYGRYNPETGLHDINDLNTSPCIDAGVPFLDYSFEPEDNGGRINMGTYGNTSQASLSGAGIVRFLPADIDEDGDVDMVDLAILTDNWLLQGAAIQTRRADVDNDGIVNFLDFAIFAYFWPWP